MAEYIKQSTVVEPTGQVYDKQNAENVPTTYPLPFPWEKSSVHQPLQHALSYLMIISNFFLPTFNSCLATAGWENVF